MSKKILSLALAVVMLFSICAVAVSAGDGSETIKIRITSDAEVGAPAGTVVTVSYYVDLPVDELQMAIGNVALGYDSTAYKVNSSQTANANDAREWGPAYVDSLSATSAVTISATISNNIVKKFNANDTAKGWDKALQVQLSYNNANGFSGQTGFPVYSGELLFTLEFVALRTLTADDVIGVVEGAYGQSFFKVCWFNGTTTAQLYPVAQVNMTEAVAVAPSAPSAPAYDVYKLADTQKHQKANGTFKTASFFAFKNIAPDFNTAGTSQFITAITAEVTVNGTPVAAGDIPVIKYVYDLGDGEYGFRVILDNIADANATITVTPVVTTTDGATYNVETISFTVAGATAA